ncbi:MAG TPA: ABC-F family ATP-binding cassette domain-containing protein [Mobilitalea sp.]|nr:ABC-F family ATP-binding cassette domain-containing protein [Mobilitalea sp.]
MSDVSLIGVKKYMDATLVLKNISFLVNEGEKAGIVGENGSGKSTILKLIAGIITLNHCAGYPNAPTPLGYDEGWVVRPKEATCAYLDQIPDYPQGVRVIDVLNLAFEEVHGIEKEMRSLEEEMMTLEGKTLERTLRKYSELQQLYEVKGGYGTEEKLNRVIKGLNFQESFLNQEFQLLSGGEKTTAVLGKLLIDNPDILLLDEPTNHLDMGAVEWLEEYLKSYKGTVIIVSHDRYFLDHVVTKIIEIEDKESATYQGNYSDYVRTKEENMRIQYEHFKEQQKKINSMEKSIKELRDWAMRSDNNKFFQRAASMQIKLDKMERIEKPALERQNMKLNLNTTQRSGNITIKAIGLSKRFEDKVIFQSADLLVNYGERVALIGSNGSGKTTFLRMLIGEEEPEAGTARLGANVMTAYLPQKITFTNEELTVLECFREDLFILEGKAREQLAKFMFYGSNVFKKVRHLSGGERVRLMLSKLLYEDINLLILDEPTNHLDTASIETIEEALQNFKGTIFFISHDRYFINKIGERVIAIEDKGFQSYDGNYDYYKSIQDEKHLQEMDPVNQIKPSVKTDKNRNNKEAMGNKKEAMGKETEAIENRKKAMENKTEAIEYTKEAIENKKEATENKKETKENKKYKIDETQVLKRIEILEREIKEIDAAMAEADRSYEELNKLFLRKEERNKELDTVMETWLTLSH